MSLQKLRTV